MIGIAGGTGFIGSHLVETLHATGFSLRLLIRHEKYAERYAAQNIETVVGDLHDRAALEKLCAGCDTIIHLVGIIQEVGDQTWERVHVEGTRNLVEAARKAGVRQFIYNSAAGLSPDSSVGYVRTKLQAEEIIVQSGLPYTIFRPSFVIGPGDKSVNFFAQLVRWLPIVVVLDAGAKFQPVFLLDLLQCFKKAIAHPQCQNKIFEVGGPNPLTIKEIYETIARVLKKRRVWVTLHPRQMRLFARMVQWIPGAPVTLDQLRMLEYDGRCNTQPIEEALGIQFTPFEEALRIYLSK